MAPSSPSSSPPPRRRRGGRSRESDSEDEDRSRGRGTRRDDRHRGRSRSRSRSRRRGNRHRRRSHGRSRSRSRSERVRHRGSADRGDGDHGGDDNRSSRRKSRWGDRRQSREKEGGEEGTGDSTAGMHPDRLRMIRGGGGGTDRNGGFRDNRSTNRNHNRYRQVEEKLPDLNSVQRGVVVDIKKFGAFVEMEGFRTNGLIHISQLSNRHVEEADEVLQVGEEVFVKVVKIEPTPNGKTKIGLSLKDVSQENGRDLNPSNQHTRMGAENPDKYPNLFTVHQGNVVSIRDFGAFVKLDGFYSHGLVHISQMAKWKVDNPADVVSVGDRVWCKVVACEDDPNKEGKKKLSLSMKLVSQDDGEDLDRQNIEAEELQNRARYSGGSNDNKRIELGAIYNVTCSKCGGHGHLPSQCYTGKKYDLIEEEADSKPENGDGDQRVRGSAVTHTGSSKPGQEKRKKKKKKKEKDKKKKKNKSKKKDKKKKKKKKKSKSSDSDSSDSEDDARDNEASKIAERAAAILDQMN